MDVVGIAHSYNSFLLRYGSGVSRCSVAPGSEEAVVEIRRRVLKAIEEIGRRILLQTMCKMNLYGNADNAQKRSHQGIWSDI